MTRKTGVEPTEDRLLRYLQRQGAPVTATTLELAAELGCNRDTIDIALGRLRKEGLIETQRLGRGRVIEVRKP